MERSPLTGRRINVRLEPRRLRIVSARRRLQPEMLLVEIKSNKVPSEEDIVVLFEHRDGLIGPGDRVAVHDALDCLAVFRKLQLVDRSAER